MPTWEEFKQKHILNPTNHRDYESWDKRQQNNWLKNRLAGFSGNLGQEYGRKSLNSVIIATSQEILDDFRRPGVKFEPQEDFYWSNRKYAIWLFKKNQTLGDEQYSVTKLNLRHGPMHFLARTTPHDEYKPIHYHAQSPEPNPTSFPRYTDSESFYTEIRQLLQQQKIQQQQQVLDFHSDSSTMTSVTSSLETASSSSSILQIIFDSINAYILRPAFSLGNFILNKIIFKVFFIENSS